MKFKRSIVKRQQTFLEMLPADFYRYCKGVYIKNEPSKENTPAQANVLERLVYVYSLDPFWRKLSEQEKAMIIWHELKHLEIMPGTIERAVKIYRTLVENKVNPTIARMVIAWVGNYLINSYLSHKHNEYRRLMEKSEGYYLNLIKETDDIVQQMLFASTCLGISVDSICSKLNLPQEAEAFVKKLRARLDALVPPEQKVLTIAELLESEMPKFIVQSKGTVGEITEGEAEFVEEEQKQIDEESEAEGQELEEEEEAESESESEEETESEDEEYESEEESEESEESEPEPYERAPEQPSEAEEQKESEEAAAEENETETESEGGEEEQGENDLEKTLEEALEEAIKMQHPATGYSEGNAQNDISVPYEELLKKVASMDIDTTIEELEEAKKETEEWLDEYREFLKSLNGTQEMLDLSLEDIKTIAKAYHDAKKRGEFISQTLMQRIANSFKDANKAKAVQVALLMHAIRQTEGDLNIGLIVGGRGVVPVGSKPVFGEEIRDMFTSELPLVEATDWALTPRGLKRSGMSKPTKFVVFLDASGSMSAQLSFKGYSWDIRKETVAEYVALGVLKSVVDAGGEVEFYLFGDVAQFFGKYDAQSEDREAQHKALLLGLVGYRAKSTAGDGTIFEAVLREILEICNPESEGEKAEVVMISDGESYFSHYTLDKVAEVARVHVIFIPGSARGWYVLKEIAERTGGNAIFLTMQGGIPKLVSKVVEKLKPETMGE